MRPLNFVPKRPGIPTVLTKSLCVFNLTSCRLHPSYDSVPLAAANIIEFPLDPDKKLAKLLGFCLLSNLTHEATNSCEHCGVGN